MDRWIAKLRCHTLLIPVTMFSGCDIPFSGLLIPQAFQSMFAEYGFPAKGIKAAVGNIFYDLSQKYITQT
jgi:hypothetical protein